MDFVLHFLEILTLISSPQGVPFHSCLYCQEFYFENIVSVLRVVWGEFMSWYPQPAEVCPKRLKPRKPHSPMRNQKPFEKRSQKKTMWQSHLWRAQSLVAHGEVSQPKSVGELPKVVWAASINVEIIRLVDNFSLQQLLYRASGLPGILEQGTCQEALSALS